MKDTLDTAHSYVVNNAYASSLYDRVAALSASILHRLEFLQSRLPLERVDGYANGALDFVEKKFPQVKLETNQLVGKARQPADYAVETAQSYKKGIESVSSTTHSISVKVEVAKYSSCCLVLRRQRLGSVNESFYHRIAQSQETLHGLQDRLAKTVAKCELRIPFPSQTLSTADADHYSCTLALDSPPRSSFAQEDLE